MGNYLHVPQRAEADFWEFGYDRTVNAIFEYIDQDGSGYIDREEFQAWFEESNLTGFLLVVPQVRRPSIAEDSKFNLRSRPHVFPSEFYPILCAPGLMSFREFYRPIAQLDDSFDGQTNKGEFTVAMETFDQKSDTMSLCWSSMSFWFSIIFIISGIIYVINEILKGEQVLTDTDLTWRILEVCVWFGFLLGLIGYLRVYLVSVERECNDNRELVNSFKRSILSEKHEDDNEEEDLFNRGVDNALAQGLNPLELVKMGVSATTSLAMGITTTTTDAVEKSVSLVAKGADKSFSAVGLDTQGGFQRAVATGAHLAREGVGVTAHYTGVTTVLSVADGTANYPSMPSSLPTMGKAKGQIEEMGTVTLKMGSVPGKMAGQMGAATLDVLRSGGGAGLMMLKAGTTIPEHEQPSEAKIVPTDEFHANDPRESTGFVRKKRKVLQLLDTEVAELWEAGATATIMKLAMGRD